MSWRKITKTFSTKLTDISFNHKTDNSVYLQYIFSIIQTLANSKTDTSVDLQCILCIIKEQFRQY